MALFACAPPNDPLVVPGPDKHAFATQVYPILLRDCGFPECHGTGGRFLRVYGPGRLRISPTTLPEDPATEAEIEETYARARSMLTDEEDGQEPLLLRKPLAKFAGGAAHKGEDDWGRNVYQSQEDAAWRVLAAWAYSLAPEANPSASGGNGP